MYKIYRTLKVQAFDKGNLLCKYGAEGEEFFIILKGEAGVKVPIN